MGHKISGHYGQVVVNSDLTVHLEYPSFFQFSFENGLHSLSSRHRYSKATTVSKSLCFIIYIEFLLIIKVIIIINNY
jgi:hypothetical protein